MNRWCIYYATDYSTSYSVSPCRVVARDGDNVRVSLPGRRRIWVTSTQVFKTSDKAHAAALYARGVNAWA